MSILKDKEVRTVLMFLGSVTFLVLGSMIVQFNILDCCYFIFMVTCIIRYIYIKVKGEE